MKEDLQQLKLDQALSDFYRSRIGCVIRSLESVLQAKASSEELNARVEVLNNLGSLGAVVLHERQIKDSREWIKYLDKLGEDRTRVIEFVMGLPNLSTPLGNAARKYDISLKTLTKGALKSRLLKQVKTLVLTGHHVAHLGYVSETGFVSLSDGLVRLPLDPNEYYEAIFFEPPKTGKSSQKTTQLTLL